MFLTDVFHGICHKCGDEFKYHKHLLHEERDPRNTSVAEHINSLMQRFDKTVAASGIDTAMLVYDYFAYQHNAELREKMLKKIADEVSWWASLWICIVHAERLPCCTLLPNVPRLGFPALFLLLNAAARFSDHVLQTKVSRVVLVRSNASMSRWTLFLT